MPWYYYLLPKLTRSQQMRVVKAPPDPDSDDDVPPLAKRSALHTETINIWSHLIPWVLYQYNTWMVFFGQGSTFLLDYPTRAAHFAATGGGEPGGGAAAAGAGAWWTNKDVGVLYALTALQQSVMLFSACAHAFHPISRRTSRVMWSLDYAGIALAIAGAGASLTWAASACVAEAGVVSPTAAQVAWLAGQAVLLSVILPLVARPEPGVRGHVSLGLHALVSWAIALCLSFFGAWHAFHEFQGIEPFWAGVRASIYAALWIVAGCAFFFGRLPDRWLEKWFADPPLIGHSHQLWHVCVAAGCHFVLLSSAHLSTAMPAIREQCRA